MVNHSSWDDLASENERLIAPTDSFDRIPVGAAMSTAGGPARHGMGGSDGASPLAAKPPSARTRRWRMTRKSAGAA
jgi:hypothetical protein